MMSKYSTVSTEPGSSKEYKKMEAADFFESGEAAEKNKTMDEISASTQEKVVELINNAAFMPKALEKIENLRQVQELIIHKCPDLLDNFLDEMLAYQTDKNKEVRKYVVGFLEIACKTDFELVPKVIPSLVMMFADDNVEVQKKVILTFPSIVKISMAWIIKSRKTEKKRNEMLGVWAHLIELQSLLYEMLESDNDGVRTHVVKCLEGCTLTLSRKTSESEIPKKQQNEMSLDQVPESNEILKTSKLEEDGRKAFSTLLQFQSSPHVSSINLMTVMSALSNIAKQRPQFFDQVVQSFEALHVNLPPTLAKSQVSSVRKNLKIQLTGLLKHSSSVGFIPQITTLLTDLGASQSEINKLIPKESESRKRKAIQDQYSTGSVKKTKVIEIDEDDDVMTPWVDRASKKKMEPSHKQTAIDVTAEDILPRLNAQNVADLVLLSMVMLPDTMPATFDSTYTPIAAAGTETQISHIARLLATQLTMAGMGKGLGELKMQAIKESRSESIPEDVETSPKHVIPVLGIKSDTTEPVIKKSKISQLPLPPVVRKIKQFSLSDVTRPMSKEVMAYVSNQAISRIISAEPTALSGHVENHRIKLLSTLTTMHDIRFKTMLQEYIMNDLRSRYELAFAWLYQEYTNSQGFDGNHMHSKRDSMVGYDVCLCGLLDGFMQLNDNFGDSMFHRLLLEAPVITDKAKVILRAYIMDKEHTDAGMKTLVQLIRNRPAHRLKFLADALFVINAPSDVDIRSIVIKHIQELHSSGLMQKEIENYANVQLKSLLQTHPPPAIGEVNMDGIWTEDQIKKHLYLHLALLPSNHKLIHDLASIYTATSADIKRTILRVLETPVRGMGMESPELLTLVENCPKGSETLVMRVIHILTDKAVPSPDLVTKIRDLYHKRVPDVRFLIPVLNGLSKNEVMEALPKLIKLNPMVVKEVFNRLMGSHVSNESVYHSPLTPVELLTALHNIDPVKCDMKTIIKAANLCFSERSIYTEEVMAIVMQQLMEQDPLPTLLMRTVIQALIMYPRLIGFVLNILQRLIMKKVWKQKKVWEGFIRCCQRATPQSFQVLLQLPAAQLKEVFNTCPDLQEPLLEHVNAFTDNQKAHINKAVMEVLEQSVPDVSDDLEKLADTEVPDMISNGKDSRDDHKVSSFASTPSEQRIGSLASGNTSENSPPRSNKSSGIKITLQPSRDSEKSRDRDRDSIERDRKRDRDSIERDRKRERDSIERDRKRERDSIERDRKRERDVDLSDYRKKSKSSRQDDSDEEMYRSRSSRSSKSSSSYRSSSRK